MLARRYIWNTRGPSELTNGRKLVDVAFDSSYAKFRDRAETVGMRCSIPGWGKKKSLTMLHQLVVFPTH